MENNWHVPDLVYAFPYLENVGLDGLVLQAICAKKGAYLANFETLEEAMLMKTEVMQKNSGLHYYVGGSNINRYIPGGDWRWTKNGQMTKMTYYALGGGQPDGSLASPQDCMLFYATERCIYHDVFCDNGSYRGGYICEK